MKKNVRVAKLLLPYLRLHPWVVASIVILGLLSSLAEGIGISLFIPFLHTLGQDGATLETGNWLADTLGRIFAAVPPERRLLFIAACILGSILLRTSLAYGHSICYAWLDARIGHHLRSGIFSQLLRVSYPFLQSRQSGDLWNTLATETWRMGQALGVLVGMIITLCTLSVYVTLLLLISWRLTLLVAVAMLLISMVARRLTRRVKVLGRLATRSNARLADRMLEGFRGMKTIRVFNREPYEQRRFDHASQRVSRVFFHLGVLSSLVSPVYEVLAGMLLVVILLVTVGAGQNLASMLVFIFVLYRLQPKIKALDTARVGLSSLTAPVEDVTGLLDSADKPYVRSGSVPFDHLRDGIRFENVTFQYESTERPALEDVTVKIAQGKTTALVGPSGGGKSTFINLLFRFYEPAEGTVWVDEHALPELDLEDWRRQIGMVSQEVQLFNTSIYENIAYGRPEATNEQIEEAAKLADAHGFITQLPRGYRTLLGDEGVWLSGGQQQRLALARAIVRDPNLLILDEATNALDSISEHVIQQALERLRENRTVILIAHRLSTIEQADHIIVLEQGRVAEQGRFEDLLRDEGLFARLYHLQYRRAPEPQE